MDEIKFGPRAAEGRRNHSQNKKGKKKHIHVNKTYNEKRQDWWIKKQEKRGLPTFKKRGEISDESKKILSFKKERLQKRFISQPEVNWEEDQDLANEEASEDPEKTTKKKKKRKNRESGDEPGDPSGPSLTKFQKAQQRYKEFKERKQQQAEERKQARIKHKQAVEEYSKKRKERFCKLSKKTSRGQPFMRYRMENLLEQVKAFTNK